MGVFMDLKADVFGLVNELEKRAVKVVCAVERAGTTIVVGITNAFGLLVTGLLATVSALVQQFIHASFDVLRSSLEVLLGELDELTEREVKK